jgi:hypothetical protein
MWDRMRFSQVVLAATMMVSCLTGWQAAAFAGSDNSNNAWAGDVGLLALPPGTVVATEYIGYRHSDEYVTSSNNFFSKLNALSGTGFGNKIPSTVDLYTSVTRFSYITRLWDHPLAFSAAAVFAKADNFNVGNFPVPTGLGGAFGPQTIGSSFADPSVFISYGLIVDPRRERFLSVSNYFYFPAGNYNKFKAINYSTAGQYTWVPQVGYAEGLAKFGLKGFWLDVIANMSVHTDGNSPLALAVSAFPFPAGAQFDKLTQGNSYDIKAFVRYNFLPGGHVAIGIERSWGGEQIASGGILGGAAGPTSLGMEDFVKGHIQASMPLTRDFFVAADITHDFERSGGFREDFTAEIRFTKLFTPQPPPQPLK